MTNIPVISVIIDAYNYGGYIEAAVASALNQTLPREMYEVIVVDDGSTDDTCQRLQKFLPHIVYHYKENGGQATAINAGIDLANGEFVAFLDADDYWSPEKLSLVLEKFRSDEQVGVVYHKLAVVNNAGKELEIFPQCFGSSAFSDPVQRYDDWLTAVGVATSGISFRTAVVRNLTPIPAEFTICADAYLMSCAPFVTGKFALIDAPLGSYRIHDRNNFSGLSTNGRFQEAKSEELSLRYLKLVTEKRELLAQRIGSEVHCLPMLLKSRLFKVEIHNIKQKDGIATALQALWAGRNILTQLPLKYMLFRLLSILIPIFFPEELCSRIRHIYSGSWLWRAVNSR
jgi:glycosyltransferase involved in cell wall biosynthesis